MNNASFNISVSFDNVLEGNETFLITIEQTSIQTVIISENSTLIVIIDDDRKYFESPVHCFTPIICTAIMISFSQSSYSVNEDDGVVQPELILSNPSSNTFTIQVISNNITALSKH